MRVDICNANRPELDDFVRRMPGAKLCHLFAWAQNVVRPLGHTSFYLVAQQDGAVCGVLPLTLTRSRLFGNRMISEAFSNYGGPLAEDGVTSEALYHHAIELSIKHRCTSLELRNIEPLPYDLHRRTDKVTMCLPLTSDPEDLWNRLRPQIRNRIRKAEKAGLTVLSGGREMLGDFYRIWTRRMHQLGTPCYPRKLFVAILKAFPQDSRIFLVNLNGTVVGGLFVHSFNGLAESRWGAVLTEYNEMSPNYLLNWAAMQHFGAAGAQRFDFGRSTVGSGQHVFKQRWGAEEIPLAYQYWTRPGQELSIAKPDNPKYAARVETWKKLPLWITRLAGPYISCSLP
ncbi:MAG TPA: FemAB family XrtA/PEP-CTERM system-associated protein [Sedimentisphaerales bacterium]|nr:FemAB family XrtA/PEP-CTERM system-associated protein [Sedimentisphaerales bacterium]